MALKDDEDSKGWITLLDRPLREVTAMLSGMAGSTVQLKVLRVTQEGSSKEAIARAKRYVMNPNSDVVMLSRTNRVLSVTEPRGAATYEPRTPTNRVVLPDVRKWAVVTNGMDMATVRIMLGHPLEELPGPPGTEEVTWIYGWLRFDAVAFPEPLTFSVFVRRGVVHHKLDPFEGRYSTNDAPMQPRAVIPLDGQVFDHYPRFLDLRWTPSSGKYPMYYQLEIDTMTMDGWQTTRVDTDIPYCCVEFGGMNEGRWRVRARNEAGESEWSSYRNFRFAR